MLSFIANSVKALERRTDKTYSGKTSRLQASGYCMPQTVRRQPWRPWNASGADGLVQSCADTVRLPLNKRAPPGITGWPKFNGDDLPPSLQHHYRAFITTTRQSAPPRLYFAPRIPGLASCHAFLALDPVTVGFSRRRTDSECSLRSCSTER